MFNGAELTGAIASHRKATEVRQQSLRTYGADYKTVFRMVQPQVMHVSKKVLD
jgi:hypothetical protein